MAGSAVAPEGADYLEKHSPHDGRLLSRFVRSRIGDVRDAVAAAVTAQPGWAALTPVQRGDVLHAVAMGLTARAEDVAETVALETGKSIKRRAGGDQGGGATGAVHGRGGDAPLRPHHDERGRQSAREHDP